MKKSSPVSVVVEAVRMVLAGNHYASEHIKNKLGHQNAAQVTAAAVRWLDDSSFSI